jgi:hypothetical protein
MLHTLHSAESLGSAELRVLVFPAAAGHEITRYPLLAFFVLTTVLKPEPIGFPRSSAREGCISKSHFSSHQIHILGGFFPVTQYSDEPKGRDYGLNGKFQGKIPRFPLPLMAPLTTEV